MSIKSHMNLQMILVSDTLIFGICWKIGLTPGNVCNYLTPWDLRSYMKE